MRLKQLLGVGLAVVFFTALAAADSQLTDISVQGKGNAATVIIRTNGALTHNEYRPVDNLLLVDFPETDIGTLDSSTHTVNVPGITSYQVHSYKAANGSQIARVELTLVSHASVRLTNESNAVLVSVSTDSQAAPSVAKTPETAAPAFAHASVLKPSAIFSESELALAA